MNRITKVLKTSSIAMLFAIMATGCSFYKSQVSQMPLVSQKGELVAEASIVAPVATLGIMTEDLVHNHSISINDIKYRLSCAYGLTDHIAIQLSSKNLFMPRHQAMVGWYTPAWENGVFEVYGGYAYEVCSSFDGFEDVTMRQDGHAQIYFVQADLGLPSYQIKWWPKIKLTAAVGMRTGGVFMNYTQTDYLFSKALQSPKTVTEVESEHDDSRFALQPMMKFGLGGERWKIELGAMFLWMSGDKDPQYDPLSMALGFSYRLPLKFNH